MDKKVGEKWIRNWFFKIANNSIGKWASDIMISSS
jgi:hypothetical protein